MAAIFDRICFIASVGHCRDTTDVCGSSGFVVIQIQTDVSVYKEASPWVLVWNWRCSMMSKVATENDALSPRKTVGLLCAQYC